MSQPPPTIHHAVATPDGDMIRVSMVIDGKITPMLIPRHVAAGLVAVLAQALALAR